MSNDWITWKDGGGVPVDPKTLVQVMFRDDQFGKIGQPCAIEAGSLLWNHNGTASDIVAYRPARRAEDIGDINSTAKGSGARFNSGKPDLSLIPLRLLAATMSEGRPAATMTALGRFQSTHSTCTLLDAIEALGLDGTWSECARVFSYGKKKYAAWNWAKGMPWSVPLACAARHLMAMDRGEHIDPESGEPHRGHVACNIVMLLEFVHTFPEGNDLPAQGVLA